MTKFTRSSASIAALSIFMAGSAAHADVSAQQVWDDWKNYFTGFGYTVEGSETTTDSAITVSDMKLSMQMPEDAGSFEMTMSEMTFSDNGDGTVNVTIPPVMPITMSMQSPDAENVEMEMDYTSDNLVMVVSGDADDMTYEYTAAMVQAALTRMMVDGEQVDIGAALIALNDLAGSTNMKMGNLRMTEQSIATGLVTYKMDFKDPDGGGQVMLDGKFDKMAFQGSGNFPINMDASNMGAMLRAGFGFDGGFTYEGGGYTFNVEEEGAGPVQATSSSDSGSLQIAMDETQLAYAGTSDNMKIMMAGGDVPFPIEIDMAEAAFNFKMPVSKMEDQQEFKLGITLGDFSMSDMIWGIFDPAGQLPRDPATIALDMAGQAKLNFDLLDPDQMVAVENGEVMPGEFNALTLNSLTVRAAGAELTGDGSFTFDNSDLSTFDGIPAPDGAVNLQLMGGNGLLDKLVAMGLLPEDQAMGARMMMGLFAVPGDGEDTLTSTIEVKPDGQILANGQRLK